MKEKTHFGAPVIEPGGKHAAAASTAATPAARVPRTVETSWLGGAAVSHLQLKGYRGRLHRAPMAVCVGDHLVDCSVGLDGEEFAGRDVDRPDGAYSAKVMPGQVDDHQVLGPVLLRRRERGSKLLVLLRRPAAAAGAFDRLGLGLHPGGMQR